MNGGSGINSQLNTELDPIGDILPPPSLLNDCRICYWNRLKQCIIHRLIKSQGLKRLISR